MKSFRKIICLLLAVSCVFVIASCNNDGQKPAPDNTPAAQTAEPIFEVIGKSAPTRIKSLVSWIKAEDELNLGGVYDLIIDGEKMSFSYDYTRLSTVADGAEMIAEGKEPSREKQVTGTIYYQNGSYYAGSAWESGSLIPEKFALHFAPKAENFVSYSVSGDGNTLTGTIDASKFVDAFGTMLNARGPVSVEISTDGTFIRRSQINYESLEGANVSIVTTYTYDSSLTVTLPEA